MNCKAFFLPIALIAGLASSLEVSQPEWANPSRAGSAIWLINPHKWPMTVDSLWVRNIGFQSWREARFKAGNQVLTYAAKPGKGQWILLKPRDKRKLRVRAKDSLMVSAFEIGDRLRAGRAVRAPEEEFSLELRIVDNAGRACKVKIAETKPAYIIETSPDVADSGPGED
jgi:hypothetical protein